MEVGWFLCLGLESWLNTAYCSNTWPPLGLGLLERRVQSPHSLENPIGHPKLHRVITNCLQTPVLPSRTLRIDIQGLWGGFRFDSGTLRCLLAIPPSLDAKLPQNLKICGDLLSHGGSDWELPRQCLWWYDPPSTFYEVSFRSLLALGTSRRIASTRCMTLSNHCFCSHTLYSHRVVTSVSSSGFILAVWLFTWNFRSGPETTSCRTVWGIRNATIAICTQRPQYIVERKHWRLQGAGFYVRVYVCIYMEGWVFWYYPSEFSLTLPQSLLVLCPGIFFFGKPDVTGLTVVFSLNFISDLDLEQIPCVIRAGIFSVNFLSLFLFYYFDILGSRTGR